MYSLCLSLCPFNQLQMSQISWNCPHRDTEIWYLNLSNVKFELFQRFTWTSTSLSSLITSSVLNKNCWSWHLGNITAQGKVCDTSQPLRILFLTFHCAPLWGQYPLKCQRVNILLDFWLQRAYSFYCICYFRRDGNWTQKPWKKINLEYYSWSAGLKFRSMEVTSCQFVLFSRHF